MTETRALTVPEVAERLGLSVHQVYRRMQRGDLAYSMERIEGRNRLNYLINEDVLDAYIAAGQPLTVPTPDTEMISVPEAARMLGFTTDTVRRLCHEGRLEFVRGGGRNGHFRIYRFSIEMYMSSTTQNYR